MSGTHSAAPQHIAIIMDGNGRWARSRGLPREAGHERGVEALRRTVEACRDLDLSHLTVFSFSSENWKRPASEVSSLFGLLKLYVRQDLKRLTEDGVRVRIIGSRTGLPDDILDLLAKAESDTAHNARFNLNIAFNYGARDEIIDAVQRIASEVASGHLDSDNVTVKKFEEMLWFHDIPDPDLLIRTSGEYRISNFLLWQLAYTELVFLDCLWPDFSDEHLREAIKLYHKRDRRFGGLAADGASR